MYNRRFYQPVNSTSHWTEKGKCKVNIIRIQIPESGNKTRYSKRDGRYMHDKNEKIAPYNLCESY